MTEFIPYDHRKVFDELQRLLGDEAQRALALVESWPADAELIGRVCGLLGGLDVPT